MPKKKFVDVPIQNLPAAAAAAAAAARCVGGVVAFVRPTSTHTHTHARTHAHDHPTLRT